MGEIMLGIIGGSLFFDVTIFEDAKFRRVKTRYGRTFVKVKDNVVFLPRHGIQNNVPPHKIRNKANISALDRLGVKEIVSITSVGSLKPEIAPGSIVIPDDYICLWTHRSFFENEIKHLTPEMGQKMRDRIISIATKKGIPVISKGTYLQTKGPRLETRAEVRLLRNFADVVGMTMASEAMLSQELEIDYATISSVDNYANGLVEEELTIEQIASNQIKNSKKIIRLISALIKES